MSAPATTIALAWVLTLSALFVAEAAEAQVQVRVGNTTFGFQPRHFEDISGDLPNEPVTAVAIDPTDPQVIYAGMDGFLFLSDDGGESWRPVLSFPRGVLLDDTNADLADDADDEVDVNDGDDDTEDPEIIIVDEDGQEIESGDLPDGDLDDLAATVDIDVDDAPPAADGEELPEGAETANDDVDTTVFARTLAGVRAVVFVPSSPGVVYVATPRGLYRAIARGTGFERLTIPGGVAHNDVRDIAIDPARPSRLHVATAAGMLTSKDGGASFESAHGASGSTPALCVVAVAVAATSIANAGSVVILAGTERGLFRSTDAGETFLEVLMRGLPPFFAVAAVAIDQRDSTFYAGTSKGLYAGERGAALLERRDGIGGALVQAILPSALRSRDVVVGTGARGVLFSSDSGLTVEERAEQVPAAEVLSLAQPKTVDPKLADQVVVATDRGLFRSMPGTGVTMSASTIEKLRATWSKELSLDETARQALAYSQLPTAGSMVTRAGLAKLLPRLIIDYDVRSGRTTERDVVVVRAGADLPPGTDPDDNNTDLFGNVGIFVIQPAEGFYQALRVRLIWDLDKVIFNPDLLAVSRKGTAWYTAERRVLDRVQELWSVRRRLMAEESSSASRGNSDAAVREQLQRRLRVDELTAQLDGATGGAFSNSIVEDSR